MLIRLLAQATPAERAWLRVILGRPRRSRTLAEVQAIRERMDAYGCIDYARSIAHALAGAALHEYAPLFGHLRDTRDRRFLEGVVRWVLERT